MTLADYLKVFVSDAIARAKDHSGAHIGRRVIENTVRDLADGAIDELAERFPLLLGVEMQNLDLKEILRALLPVFKLVAQKTPNQYDDWVVSFIEQFAQSSTATAPAAVMAAMPPPPA